jgi:hypothetical protein
MQILLPLSLLLFYSVPSQIRVYILFNFHFNNAHIILSLYGVCSPLSSKLY